MPDSHQHVDNKVPLLHVHFPSAGQTDLTHSRTCKSITRCGGLTQGHPSDNHYNLFLIKQDVIVERPRNGTCYRFRCLFGAGACSRVVLVSPSTEQCRCDWRSPCPLLCLYASEIQEVAKSHCRRCHPQPRTRLHDFERRLMLPGRRRRRCPTARRIAWILLQLGVADP